MRRQWEGMGCIFGSFLHILGSFLAHLGVVFGTFEGRFLVVSLGMLKRYSQFDVEVSRFRGCCESFQWGFLSIL